MKKKLRKKLLFWKSGLKFLIIAVFTIVVAFGVARTMGFIPDSSANREKKDTFAQIKTLEKTEETVLLNVGIQKIETVEKDSTFPGTKIKIPLSVKKAIIILNYKTKIGIKEPIKITRKENTHEYIVKIPQYQFIGVELDKKAPYKLYNTNGELLSFTTKDIDTGALVVDSLKSSEQETYLEQYKDLVTESATSYFTNIIKAIDPEAKITFDNANK